MKVHPFKIPKKPNENIIVQIDKAPLFYDRLHQHEEIQLSYIVSGKGKLLVGNSVSTFEPGNFIAVGSNLPHLFQSQEGTEVSQMISLFFLKESFGKGFFEMDEMRVLTPLFELMGYGLKWSDHTHFLGNLFNGLKKQDKFNTFLKFLKLLHYLSNQKCQQLTETGYPQKLSANQGERLQLVFDYAFKNFNKHLDLGEVAAQIHMSKNAFCRFFKQRTNKTFFQFISELRIEHACELMAENQEMAIAEVALLSGYSSISNFNRQFKQLKRSNPRAYRDKL